MKLLEKVMTSLSKPNIDSGSKEFDLIGNAFGFFALHPGLGQSTLCLELAILIASNNLNVCIVDCDPLSTFYLTKSMNKLKSEDITELPSISKRLKKRSTPINETLIMITEGVSVMSFGDTQYIDTFNLEGTVIKEAMEELKEVFDLVILDIPGYPWLESTISALQVCSTVYTLCQFATDTVLKKIKYDNFFSIAGMDNILSNLVVARVPQGMTIAKTFEKRLGVKVLLEIPQVPGIPTNALANLATLDKLRGKEAVRYAKCLDFFSSEILEGISDKEVYDDDSEALEVVEVERPLEENTKKKKRRDKERKGEK